MSDLPGDATLPPPDVRDDEPTRTKVRPGPVLYVLIGLGVGAIAMLVGLWATTGNPFSSHNRVEYLVIEPVTVDVDEGQVCWSDEPERRDAQLPCAVLTVDPATGPPTVGEPILAGVVELRAPDDTDQLQMIYVAPPPADAEVDRPAPDGVPGQSGDDVDDDAADGGDAGDDVDDDGDA